MDDEQKVSQRYRDLGAEEPPRRVDEAILAASRRTAEMHPAPLVPPTGRRQWYFPLAAAAVIVLAVAVTWHMQVEEPDPYGYGASAPAQPPKEEAQAAREGEDRSADALLAKRRDAPAAASPPPAPRMERRADEQSAPIAGARAREPKAAQESFAIQAIEPPERMIERIVELRKQGKHEEADKLLEAFRKRHPDYKLPEAALRK